ncbi:MAG: DUF2877 domain-containing protein [Micropruina sp.]|nr:DUF2877 domain-containing protein [Micropruina sp.]
MREYFEAGVRRAHQVPTLSACAVELIGHRSVVLSNGPDLVTLTRDQDGLLPGGIGLATEAFESVRAVLAGLDGGRSAPSWLGDAALPVSTDLTLLPGRVLPEALAELTDLLHAGESGAGLIDAGPLRSRAAGLVPALSHPQWARRELTDLIGVGPGTTPSGDDIVVGAIAGLVLTGRRRELNMIGGLVSGLLLRTTRTSQHFLGWALRGHFASTVLAVADGLRGVTPLAPAVTELRGWGSSSGTDLLHGLLGVLSAPRLAKDGVA